ncbi:hypothetical protein Tco_1256080 [Tanacetum coccineum]
MEVFLEKSTGSKGFHQVIDFLSHNHISYALTKKPDIYISFIKQFWRTAEDFTDTNGEVTITTIIDGQSKTITEASLRRHLKLEDHDGITSIPNSEIFAQLALMGYQPDSDKLTFQKGVFSPQWRLTKGYTGVEIELFPTMLTSPPPEPSPTPSSSPSRITSSPSLSSEPFTAPTFEPQPSPDAEYHVPTPNESPLHVVHSHRSDEGSLKLNELTNLVTKLSERIGVLEDDLKKTKQTYSSAFTKLILRIKKLESKVKTGKARKRARVVLSEDEEDDSSKQGRINEDPNTYFAQDDEVVHDQDTAAENLLVLLSKKLLEQERQGLEEAIRLQKQVDEEEKAQIARDEEIARQLLALDEERVTTDPKTTKDIDWNDPSVQKYWNMKNKPKSEAQARKNMIVYLKNQSNYKMKDFDGMSYEEIRPIFEKVWDFNHNFVPMDLGIEKEKKKPAEFQVEQIEKDTTGKRKKSLPRTTTRSSTKKQKVELNDEKEDLKGYLDIFPREDVAVNVDSLSTRYPIVDWKTYTLSENFMYYKIIRGDRSSKNYKILSQMLYDFDRQDIMELYRLVKESLCDFCGVHILLMQNGIAIHMLTEKKYPLSQEMISKMLSKRLEVDQESTQAYELLKFIRSQVKNMSVVYVLTTPMPKDGGEIPTMEQNVETSKELWDTLEAKYMAEDASSKKFLVSNFTNYKMTDSRPVFEQYNELLGILGRFTQHKMNMDESIKVSCIIDKLPPSWKDFKHTLKHLKQELTLIELGSHLRIEESLRA